MKFHFPIYRHLSIAKKITVLLILVSTLCFISQTFIAYLLVSKNIELDLGKRLEHIARSGALLISGKTHNQIVEDYLAQDPNLTTSRAFKKVQAALQKIKEANQLKTDVYTVIRPEWKPDTMIFICMAKEKPYVGNGLPLHPQALLTLEKGEAHHTGLYEDKEGLWVSAWAPIKTEDGKTVAVLEVDYRASEEVAAAKIELLRDLLLPVLGAILLCLLLGSYSGRALAKPLKILAAAAVEVSKGNLDVRVETDAGDEVGRLSTTFNVMVEDIKKSRAALEDYAKNLEVKVAERTAELTRANETISAMINSLSQGFVVFQRDGRCLSDYSKACETLLETSPAGKPIWDVLGISEADLKGQIDFLFDEPIPFEDTAGLCPRTFEHSAGKYVTLSYYPVREESNKVSGVVLVATDQTRELEATQAAERERAYARTVVNIVKHKNQFLDFVREAKQIMTEMKEDVKSTAEGLPLDVEKAFRLMHTLKGGAALFSVGPVATIAHDYESRLSELRTASVDTITASIPELTEGVARASAALDAFLTEHREIIGTGLDTGMRYVELPVPLLLGFAHKLSKVPEAEHLQREFVDDFAKEPIQKFFSHYDKAISELAQANGKEIAPLVFTGGHLRVLGDDYTELFATFIHAFRNAVDHGLEMPFERSDRGKDPAGKITIDFGAREASDASRWLIVSIEDDGKGIDPEIIREKLRESGRGESADRESNHEVIQHIFDSGFSTREAASEISGRGVGMGAIQQVAKKMGGMAKVISTLGKGTKLVVMIPYRDQIAGSARSLNAA